MASGRVPLGWAQSSSFDSFEPRREPGNNRPWSARAGEQPAVDNLDVRFGLRSPGPFKQWDGLPGVDFGAAHVEHPNEANTTPEAASA